MKVYRVYVEKRKEEAVEAKEIQHRLKEELGLTNIETLSILNRYDVQGVSEETLNQAIPTILSEPMVDDVYLEDYTNENAKIFAIEYLPGQYDQRADSTKQCFELLTGETSVKVKCARVFVLTGNISEEDLTKIQHYLINPVDQRIASLDKFENLEDEVTSVASVPVIEGFNELDKQGLEDFVVSQGLAMNYDDLKVTQDYFISKKRNPTETEIKVLDTYWSDHCRHTTFSTVLTGIEIEEGRFKEILAKDIESYKASRHYVYGIETTRPMTLMDLATISMKELRKNGMLDDLEVSEEINACSVEITVKTNQGEEQW
ncbi:MAG: phosphoribosylformylglycinamidine synthase, partial [Beduini sp.]